MRCRATPSEGRWSSGRHSGLRGTWERLSVVGCQFEFVGGWFALRAFIRFLHGGQALSVVGCPFDLSLNTVDYLGHLGFGGLEDAICCSPFAVCTSTADRRSLKHRNPATTLEKSQINGLPLSISMERGLGGEVIATAKARTTVSPSPDQAG